MFFLIFSGYNEKFSGPCSNNKDCVKRVKIFCKCKRKSAKFPCNKSKDPANSLKCDEECQKSQPKPEVAAENADFLENKEEIDSTGQFSLARRKRKKKWRNSGDEEDSSGFYQSKWFIGCCFVVVLSLLVYVIVSRLT